MGITIVADELSVEKVQELQERVNALGKNHSPYEIMHQLGMKEKLSVTLTTKGDEFIMNCRKN